MDTFLLFFCNQLCLRQSPLMYFLASRKFFGNLEKNDDSLKWVMERLLQYGLRRTILEIKNA